MKVNLSEAARILGKKPETLRKWFAQDCPHERNGNKYVVEVGTVFNWRIQYERQLVANGGKSDKEVFALEVERALLARSQREKIDLEIAKTRGELIDATEAEALYSDLVLATKAKLRGTGKKIGPLVSVESDPLKCEQLICGEIDIALEELANES